METININMTPNSHEVETIHASQNDTSLRKWGIRPYDYEGNDVTNQQDKATLVDIKGQTLKWNQQSQSSRTTGTAYGLTISCTDGLWSFQGTYTGGNGSAFRCGNSNVSIPSGHKVLLLNTSPWKVRLQGNEPSTNENTPQNRILQTESGAFADIVIHAYGLTSGDTVNAQYRFGIIDLTVMFGETKANEIYAMETAQSGSGVAYFKSLFPLDFYPYNSGSLISFNGNGLKTVGFNQWNEQTQKGYWRGSDGNFVSNQSQLCSLNYISVLPNTNYCYRKALNIGDVIFYDANKVFISSLVNMMANVVFTTPSNCHFININLGSTYGATYKNDICINISDTSRNGEYEPYIESVINLPISTYFPTGMKSIEPNQYTTVEITDELIPTKATTRVGSITIDGNAPMNTNGATSEISAFIIPINGKANGRYNIMSDLFEVADGTLYSMLGRDANNNVQFALPPSVPQTVADGKAWFAQHPTTLYFELATPIETTISPELDLTFNIDKGGTEELLPSGLLNGSVDLGSLNWSYDSLGRFYSNVVNGLKPTSGATQTTAMYCELYALNSSPISGQYQDKTIATYTDSRIYIIDRDYNDVVVFKQAMQGVYLWYETTDSTPTTTPLNATIQYPAETKDVYFTYQASDFLSTVFKFYLVTKGIQIPCELEDDTLVADCTSEISNEPGFFDCKIKAENDLGQIFSNKFQLHIERSPE